MELEVKNVGLSFAGRAVLRDVNLTLPAQSRALLLGPSGSGKSSLLNIICGLQSPDSGTVTFGTATLAGAGGAKGSDSVRKRHMGIVFQTLKLVSALSVKANLALAQRLQTGSTDAALVTATLERLGIADRASARPHQLSQGEAQRAAIARALVVKPDILIADEPTSALDHANTEAVAALLIEAAEQAGASLLIATHDDRLRAHFERTLVLEDGAVREGVPA